MTFSRWEATHNCDDEFAKAHADSTNDQEAPTTHSVDQLNSEDGHYGVHNIGNDTRKGLVTCV